MKIHSEYEKTKKYQIFFNLLSDSKQLEIIENEILHEKNVFSRIQSIEIKIQKQKQNS